MLFNSYIFVLVFLPIVLLLYYLLGKINRIFECKVLLIISSLIFYAYNNVYYLLLICISLVVNYLASKLLIKCMDNKLSRNVVFAIALLTNIGILFYFKYFDFFAENIYLIFSKSYNYMNLILPLGISFYTFQQISYITDVYKGDVEKYSFVDYSLFVTFFPQLIAGPIALHSEMIPQFRDEKNYSFRADSFSEGIYDFSIGLAKKVLIADKFAVAVNEGYARVANLTTIESWLVMLFYTLQIYFDFSGYCDMAEGIAKMFNFSLPINFMSPYKSKSISEFWQRWHITLGRFLRQYLYFPLGGNRKGKARTYLNLLIVFFVSGLWHGANWTFILWGAVHGIFSCLYRMSQKHYDKINGCLRCGITFFIVNILWVLFRANSISEAICFYSRMFSWNGYTIDSHLMESFKIIGVDKLINLFYLNKQYKTLMIRSWIWFLFTLGIVFSGKNIYEQTEKTAKTKAFLSVACIVLSLLSFSNVTTFLYFNF